MVELPMPDPPQPTGNMALAPLMQRITEGDEGALEALYSATSGRVYAMALRILRDASQAEEVTLDVFHHVWRHAPSYDPDRGSVLAWMIVQVRSRAIDRLRAAKPREVGSGAEVLVDQPSPVEGPEVVAQGSDRAQRLRDALRRVSDAQREALHAAFFGGMTHVEIARANDLPLGTVKRRIRDGLRHLRDILGSCQEEWA